MNVFSPTAGKMVPRRDQIILPLSDAMGFRLDHGLHNDWERLDPEINATSNP